MSAMDTPSFNLMGRVHIAQDADRLFQDLGDDLLATAQHAVQQRGRLHLALSGGSTPKPFYTRLATDPRFAAIPWPQTHLWIVDERRVGDDDDRSNVKMIRESLASRVPLEDDHLHPMPILDDDPATRYEDELRAAFGPPATCGPSTAPPRLDFVLLGMGDDGHTASLFPGSPALEVSDRWVAVNDGASVTPPPRVTMTFPLLNAARRVAVLVTGQKKHAMLQRISRQITTAGADPRSLPITGIAPTAGELVWYLDAPAAGQ